jgi:hypothetical protein
MRSLHSSEGPPCDFAETATGFRFYRAAILCQVEFETSDV